VIEALAVVVPFGLGFIVGRWWALLGPAAFGVWIGFTTDVEVPHWFLGAAAAVASAIPVVVGVAMRRAYRADRDRACRPRG
jgi:hypothetical protein